MSESSDILAAMERFAAVATDSDDDAGTSKSKSKSKPKPTNKRKAAAPASPIAANGGGGDGDDDAGSTTEGMSRIANLEFDLGSPTDDASASGSDEDADGATAANGDRDGGGGESDGESAPRDTRIRRFGLHFTGDGSGGSGEESGRDDTGSDESNDERSGGDDDSDGDAPSTRITRFGVNFTGAGSGDESDGNAEEAPASPPARKRTKRGTKPAAAAAAAAAAAVLSSPILPPPKPVKPVVPLDADDLPPAATAAAAVSKPSKAAPSRAAVAASAAPAAARAAIKRMQSETKSAKADAAAVPKRSAAESADAKLFVLLCGAGDLSAVHDFLRARPTFDVDAANDRGDTGLMEASYKGRVEVMRHLIGAGADPNRTDSWFGNHALFWCATSGKTDAFQYLITETKSELNKCAFGGNTALMDAAIGEHFSIIETAVAYRYPDIDFNLRNHQHQTIFELVAKDASFAAKVHAAIKRGAAIWWSAVREQRKAMLMGTHARAGAGSAIRTGLVSQSNYDRNVWPLIWEVLSCERKALDDAVLAVMNQKRTPPVLRVSSPVSSGVAKEFIADLPELEGGHGGSSGGGGGSAKRKQTNGDADSDDDDDDGDDDDAEDDNDNGTAAAAAAHTAPPAAAANLRLNTRRKKAQRGECRKQQFVSKPLFDLSKR